MSVRAMAWAWTVKDLTSSEKLLLLAIADSYSDDVGAFPSKRKLLEKTGLSMSTYERVIASLEEKKLVSREERFAPTGRQTSNLYSLGIPPQDDGGTPLKMREGEDRQDEGGHILIRKKELKTNKEDPHFQQFWKNYPRKEAKAAAIKAWNRLSDVERLTALKTVTRFTFSADPKYIPLPASWINGRRWEDVQEQREKIWAS